MAGTLKGKISAYLIEESDGKPVSLATLMKYTGERGEEGARRIQASIGHIKRQGLHSDGLIKIRTDVQGSVWTMTNWSEVQPPERPQPDVEPSPEPREVVAELEEDEAEPVEHVCAFTVVGMDADGKPLVRDSKAQIFRLLAI